MMKALYCIALLVSLSLAGATAGEWKNSLTPAGKPGAALALASAGKTTYSIVLPAKPTTQEEKAAADLSKYLKEMTGADFPIVREGDQFKPTGKQISVGNTELMRKANLPEAKLNLGREGYAIAQRGSNLYLLGGTKRGPIFAVYALLEEDLGCRWYDRQAKPTIPHVATLKFRPVPRHFVPVLNIRDPYYWDAFDGDWAIANRTNPSWSPVIPQAWGGTNKNAGHLFVHTYNALLPPGTYFKEHPEYFSELGGQRKPVQLCLTNPDVLRIVTDRVIELLRTDSGSEYISVSPNDGRGYCECAKCKAIDDADGTKAGTLIRFVNSVADSVAKEFPDVKITTLAYLDTLMPPKAVRPRSNVVIQLCTDRHAWANPFLFITETERFQTAMNAWHSIGATMHIWDYTVNFSHYSLPMPNMPIVAPNLRHFVQNSAAGVMFQGAYQGPGSDNGILRSWVWAKQLWDPSRPTLDLMRDFVYGYYGTSAEPMWQYNRMLWRMWEVAHAAEAKSGKPALESPILPDDCRYPATVPLLSKDYISKATVLFAQAESLAKDPETLRRVKLAKFPLLYTKLSQGVGYIDDRNEFVVGELGKSPSPEAKVVCVKMVDELDAIAKSEKITFFAEGGADAARKIAKWREVLTQDLPKVTSVPIDNNWRFKPDPDDKGVSEKWYSIETNDSAWAKVRSDTDQGWDTQGFEDYLGYGWYRQQVTIPKDFDQRKHLYVLFRGVDEDAEVFINGTRAFDHTGDSTGLRPEEIWITPFVFDARPLVILGEKNLVTVRVYNRSGMGGVHKPAYIVSTDAEPDVAKLVLAVRAAEAKHDG